MHEEEWMHYRCEIQRYPRPEAKSLWGRIKADIPDAETDAGGPAHSRHRQRMPTEEFGESSTRMPNATRVSGSRQPIG